MRDGMSGSEDAYQQALGITVESGALVSCKICGDDVCQNELDPSSAFRLGAAKFKRGEVSGFESQRELTDEIQAVFDDAYDGTPGLCSRCDHNLNTD